MSAASRTASASTRKPLTLLPSSMSSVPIESGGGTEATKRPKPSGGERSRSPSRSARPSPGAAAQQAGLRRRRPPSAIEAVVGGGRARRGRRSPPSATQLPVERHAGEVRTDARRPRCGPETAVGSVSAAAPAATPSRRASSVRGECRSPATPASSPSAPARPDQRHAEGAPVGEPPAGTAIAAEVEQVDEIRIGAEPRVRADRIGLDLGERAGRRDRRHAEEIELATRPARSFARAPSAGRCPRRPRLAESFVAPPMILARHRMQALRPRLDHLPDRGVALGHPGALVEKRRRRHGNRRRGSARSWRRVRASRRERHLDRRSADAASPKKIRSALRRHADPQRSAGAAGRPAPAASARERIVGIVAGEHCEGGPGILDGQREHRDAIERAAGRARRRAWRPRRGSASARRCC